MSSTAKGKLTPKQEKFCEIYVETGNASEAYRRAYDAGKMSDQAIHVNASKLLKNAKVALRIEELESLKAEKTESVAQRLEITIERTLEELARIAYANVADFMKVDADGLAYVDLTGVTREQMAGIAEVHTTELKTGRQENAPVLLKTRLKLADKKGALVELLKHLMEMQDKKRGDQPVDERPREPDAEHLAKLQKLFGGYAQAGTSARH